MGDVACLELRQRSAPVGEVLEHAGVGVERAEAAIRAAHDAHAVPDVRHAEVLVDDVCRAG
jgi:hypothetical protein